MYDFQSEILWQLTTHKSETNVFVKNFLFTRSLDSLYFSFLLIIY